MRRALGSLPTQTIPGLHALGMSPGHQVSMTETQVGEAHSTPLPRAGTPFPGAVVPSPIPTPLLPPGLLGPLPPALEAAGPPQQRATAAVGSSVLLPGLDNVTHSDSVQWEFRNGSGSHTILQHHGGAHPPAIHAPYAGRAVFHPSNGSLTLEDVQESDSGTYRVTVSTGDRKSLEIRLEVLRECWGWEGGAGRWIQAEFVCTGTKSQTRGVGEGI